MVEGGITEGYLFIDCRQDANTVPRYDACTLACALVGIDNLVRWHVRFLLGWTICAWRRILFLLDVERTQLWLLKAENLYLLVDVQQHAKMKTVPPLYDTTLGVNTCAYWNGNVVVSVVIVR